MEALALCGLNFTYAGAARPALHDLSLSVEAGSFVTLCGATGSGKSTLLRLLKRELSPAGTLTGEIRLFGQSRDELTPRESASLIGFVGQDPEHQSVSDTVCHELAFGSENLGLPQNVLRRRVSETAGRFGIEDLLDCRIDELSGGQKQLVNLAAAMATEPRLLLLDEPTAQLDPLCASAFLRSLAALNRDTGVTVILVEHRLEEALPLSDRVVVLRDGGVLRDGDPRTVAASLGGTREAAMLPAAARLWHALGAAGDCPLTVREGRALAESALTHGARLPESPDGAAGESALAFRDVWFRYSKKGADVLRNLSFDVRAGECFFLLGSNGSGKTTALCAAAGLRTPYAGSVRVFGKPLKDHRGAPGIGYLPQDVESLFLKSTVRDELGEAVPLFLRYLPDGEILLDRHPYDLSGGEKQLLALAKLAAKKPRLLLLDEPTKGLDAYAKQQAAAALGDLRAAGVTVVAVSHDVEFAALCADRCALFSRGAVTAVAPTRRFFSENAFYTTAVSRMTRGICDNAVTLADAVACRREDAP